MLTNINAGRAMRLWFPTVCDTGPGQPFRRWLPRVDPDDLTNPAMLPAVSVARYGGFDRVVTLDDPAIDTYVYVTGPDPHRAEDIALDRAEDIRTAVRQLLPGVILEDPGDPDAPYPQPRTAAVVSVRTIVGPVVRPYDARGLIARAHFAFAMRLHNQ